MVQKGFSGPKHRKPFLHTLALNSVQICNVENKENAVICTATASYRELMLTPMFRIRIRFLDFRNRIQKDLKPNRR
jgi:hypothetical protein